jgi:UDP-N-acetylglucosamine--N-acetylmuramyl-(pentapeptide) pyrophosphoryl-undecaprenol N-acetylglucosamine transferase
MKMMDRIIFAAGGTGGHIYPAIAVAEELKKINHNIKIKFIGTQNKIESSIIPNAGYDFETIDITGFKRNFSLKNIKTILKLLSAVKKSKYILKEFNPDLVFAAGGYVSGPVIKAAQALKITNVILEGNYYPGLTVKLAAKKTNMIILNFEDTKNFLPKNINYAVFSYPVRMNLVKFDKLYALKQFDLSPDKKTLFVFGGSQGAESINNALINCIDDFIDADLQIIWASGKNNFDFISSKIKPNQNIKLFSYIDKIDLAYSASDLVISRAGISAIMELAAFNLPSVLVPYPLASDNHQAKNALALAKQNAAICIEDNKLNSELKNTVLNLIKDNSKLDLLRINIAKFGDSNSARKIADFLVQIVNNRKN